MLLFPSAVCVGGSVRTLLVNVLGGKLVLLSQEIADHAGEDVAARAARAARGMLGCAGEIIVVVIKGDMASSGGNWGARVSSGAACCVLNRAGGKGGYLRCPTVSPPYLPPSSRNQRQYRSCGFLSCFVSVLNLTAEFCPTVQWLVYARDRAGSWELGHIVKQLPKLEAGQGCFSNAG
jgi:hypothetical protein